MKTQPIDNESFMNLVSLFKSKQIDYIALGLQLVESQNCQQQFQKYFGRSIEEFNDFFNNVITKITNNELQEKIICEICNNAPLGDEDICDIIINNHELSKYFDSESKYMTVIIMQNPYIIDEFDLTKLKPIHIESLLTLRPQLKPYFNK